ncbi:MAG TPA: hypothetical protein VHR39_16460 [Propionibacteriaceae bacterium]|nr:hypothetical protein [Propionibacteriaceae bacterium]
MLVEIQQVMNYRTCTRTWPAFQKHAETTWPRCCIVEVLHGTTITDPHPRLEDSDSAETTN